MVIAFSFEICPHSKTQIMRILMIKLMLKSMMLINMMLLLRMMMTLNCDDDKCDDNPGVTQSTTVHTKQTQARKIKTR